MRTTVRREWVGWASTIALSLYAAAPLAAQSARDWCEEGDRGDGEQYCEVREFRLSAAPGRIEVDARPNGGVVVEGWNENEVLVLARVVGHADRMSDAEAIAGAVDVTADRDRVEAEGPRRSGRDEWWSVSYRVFVPADYDLDLASTNGGVSVEGVNGRISMETTNGGIHLEDVAGDVKGHTTNGGLHVRLSGDRWQGAGLDVRTTNGGVNLYVPGDYNADLLARTTNGGFSIDFPITVQGKLGKQLETRLGSGGAPIRVVTTNGGVRIQRP